MEQFWRNWDKLSRNAYIFSLLLFGIAVFAAAFYLVTAHNTIIIWESFDQIENLKVAVDSFTSGVFTLPIEADAHIIFTLLVGTAPLISYSVVWCFFIAANIALVLALTSFTFLNNWLYYVGTFVVLLCFVFQQPDILFYNLWFSKFILVVPIALLGGVSYYFFAFSYKATFATRFFSIASVCFIYFGGLFYFSKSLNTVLYLTNYGSLAFGIVAIGFIFLVSFEIVYLFLFLISNSKGAGSKSGTLQFVIVYLIYTANLILQYLKNRGVIQFDFVFISPFIILLISSIVGIWGFRERSEMFKKTLPFYPIGGIMYLSWAILAAASIGYSFYTGNDPLIEVFEDTILFTHIGFGFGFCLYVAWNYGEWINSQSQVHKMIYSYRWVTFLTVYATGLIVVLCLFFYSNMFIYNQFQAGYHNYLGDIYYQSSELRLAERYYKDAEKWEFQNHKTNYSLATLYQKENRLNEALYHYRRANLKQPSAYAYANLAIMKYLQGRDLESLVDLKDGINAFPASGALKINLGVLYERIHFPDSAFYYFKQAEKDVETIPMAISNQKALFAKYGIDNKAESEVISLKGKPLTLATNELAYAIVLQKKVENESLNELIKDTIINKDQFILINNFILKTKADISDTNSLAKLGKLIANDSNTAFKTDLLYLKAIADNYRNHPFEAAKAVDLLQLSNEYEAGKYLNTLGLWALEQKNSRFAAHIFQLASDKGFSNAKLNKAVAQADAREYNAMVGTLQNIEAMEDTNTEKVVEKLISLTKPLTFNALLISDDEAKSTFLQYRANTLSDSEAQNLFYSINDKVLKLKAGMALFDLYYLKKEVLICEEILDELTKDTYSNQQLSNLNLKLLKFLVLKSDLPQLEKAIESNKLLNKDLIFLPYYEAIVAELKGETELATKKYSIAVVNCAFDEGIVLRSAAFFSKKVEDHKRAFNILLDGVAMNPYSIKLWKAYCLESIAYGLPRFGENGLESLKPLVSDTEYEAFKKTVEKATTDYTNALLGL